MECTSPTLKPKLRPYVADPTVVLRSDWFADQGSVAKGFGLGFKFRVQSLGFRV